MSAEPIIKKAKEKTAKERKIQEQRYKEYKKLTKINFDNIASIYIVQKVNR